MNRKSIIFLLLCCAFIGFASCVGKKGMSQKEKAQAEEDVRKFAEFFVQEILSGNLTTIEKAYPEITSAQGFAPIDASSIVIEEGEEPGEYEVKFSDQVLLEVSISPERNIKVTKSKGLFTFPSDKMQIAQKTGLWDGNLSDAELAKRMNDEAFFNYIRSTKSINKKDLISIGDFIDNQPDVIHGDACYDGYQILRNNTDVDIDGSDYNIVYEKWYMFPYEKRGTEVKSGKNIPANGSVKVEAFLGAYATSTAKSIKWKLSDDELQAKFAPFSGTEYQEYISSHQ